MCLCDNNPCKRDNVLYDDDTNPTINNTTQ